MRIFKHLPNADIEFPFPTEELAINEANHMVAIRELEKVPGNGIILRRPAIRYLPIEMGVGSKSSIPIQRIDLRADNSILRSRTSDCRGNGERLY